MPASRSDCGTAAATARAAASSMPSLTRLARDRTAPSPTPGNTWQLLAWTGALVVPSGRVTASNGDPVATSAPGPHAAYTSPGSHSAHDVGLEQGITRGRGVTAASAVSASLVNAPPTPDSPISACGRTAEMMSTRPAMSGVPSVRARPCLWAGRVSPRVAVTRPLESIK